MLWTPEGASGQPIPDDEVALFRRMAAEVHDATERLSKLALPTIKPMPPFYRTEPQPQLPPADEEQQEPGQAR